MRFLLFLVLIILLTCCNPPRTEDISYEPTKGSLACEVRNKAFAQLKKDKDLHPFGTGAQMMDEIKMLGLYFNYYKEIDIDTARDLLISAATVFLDTINKNEQIRPYLFNFPFKPENIEISIALANTDGSEIPPKKLCFVVMRAGILEYKANQPDSNKFVVLYTETYDEATSKLKVSDSIKLCAM